MKDNQHVQPVIDLAARTVTFRVKDHADIILHMDRLHPDIITRAALVGMAQVRIVDAAAVGRTDKDGRIIPEADRLATKHANMQALVAHYESGTAEWSQRGAGAGTEGSLTIRAIAALKGVDYATADAYVDDYLAREIARTEPRFKDKKGALGFLRKAKAVADKTAELRAEAPGAIDADEALNELGA